jgi:hypothetical protein
MLISVSFLTECIQHFSSNSRFQLVGKTATKTPLFNIFYVHFVAVKYELFLYSPQHYSDSDLDYQKRKAKVICLMSDLIYQGDEQTAAG